MSIASSEQSKKNDLLIDSLFVCLALVLVLLVLVPANGNLYSSVRTAPGAQESPHAQLLTGENVSFALDQQYWNASCSHGWSSDARCDTIVARAKACSSNAVTGYCSEYKNYLQEYLKK